MPYNLRARRMCEEMLEDDRDNENDESEDPESDNPVESDISLYATSSEEEHDEEDVDMEDATLEGRLNESRARGRPSTILRGKNLFRWNTTFPTRLSGIFIM